MSGGVAMMLGLFALAAAIVFHGLAGRYEIAAAQNLSWRVDRLTGEVCRVFPGRPVTPLDCAR